LKGLILAGGTGSRLWPITFGVSKQLIPVYDKPMIYYPLSTVMLAGCTEIAIIVAPEQEAGFTRLLGDGSQLGISITYLQQSQPRGLADAYLLAEKYLEGNSSCMALGDNLIYGPGFGARLSEARRDEGALIYGYKVSNPEAYGVVIRDPDGRPTKLVEKPREFLSDLAVPGLYFLDSSASSRAQKLTPSRRGELEITDLLQTYLEDGLLEVSLMPRGTVWLDTGNFDAMAEATEYVKVVQTREGRKIGSPEEIAWRLGLISDEDLSRLGHDLAKSGYGSYLLGLLDGPK
jgi:glucose-1-phosphate thymidylyltransferase